MVVETSGVDEAARVVQWVRLRSPSPMPRKVLRASVDGLAQGRWRYRAVEVGQGCRHSARSGSWPGP